MSTRSKIIASGTLLVATAPLLMNDQSVFADDTATTATADSASSSAVTTPVTDPEATLKTVATVNGNALTKDKAILPGDDVAWDVIATPGNTGLMTYFMDELPKGLKFSPNSKYAVTAYAVNNDGTLGDEVTNDGTIQINGQTVTWTPKDASKYFFTGADNKANRVLFHLTTVAENDVDPDVVLENLATLRVTNPKNPNIPNDITSKARVHTVKELDPTLAKKVSADNGKTWTDFEQLVSQDQTYDYSLTAILPVGTMKSSFTIDDPLDTIQSYNKDDIKIYQGDYAASMAVAAGSQTNNTASPSSAIDSNATAASSSSTAASTTGSQASLSASSDAVSSSETASSATDSAASSAEATESTVSTNASDASSATSTDDKTAAARYIVKDVTNQFKVTTDKKGVHATMDTNYLKTVRDAKKANVYTLVINGVTFKTATAEDLKKYEEGGLPYVPNTATMTVDKQTVKSNRTRVTAPKPLNSKAGAIQKAVSVDDGKSWTENGELSKQDQNYDYKLNVTAPQGSNVKGIAVTDELLAGQSVDPKNIVVTGTDANITQQDVTKDGTIKIEKNKAGNNVVTWTPSDDLVKAANAASNQPVTWTMNLTDVTLKSSTADQLKTFLKDNVTTVPNTADLVVTGQDGKTTTLQSNKVTVRIPNPVTPKPEPKSPIKKVAKKVTKAVAKDVATPVTKPVTKALDKAAEAAPAGSKPQELLAATSGAAKQHPIVAMLGALVLMVGAALGIVKLHAARKVTKVD